MTDHVRERRPASRSSPGRAVGGYADRGDAAGVDDRVTPACARGRAARCACPRRWCGRAAAARARPSGSPPRRETGPRNRAARARATPRSARSPTATSRAGFCRLRRSELPRTSTRTCQPSRSSARATAAPTKPDAPVTSALMQDATASCEHRRSRRAASATAARERVAAR